MPTPTPCPSHGQLLKLAQGELPDADLEAVCDHVAACPHCEAMVLALEFSGGVVPNLRKYAGHEAWVRTEEFSRLEVWAKELPVSSTVADEPALPTLLGKYRLVRELGRGGMGIVYEAVHTVLGRSVAVKVILPALAGDPEVLARFRREVAAVGPLAHPNVVAATDADEAGGRMFLVTELVDGLDLSELQQKVGRLSVADACEVARQAAAGLQHITDAGRVHRDLKPSNLMVSADGVVKVLDLGLARVLADGADVTRTNQIMGSADYMAPEQWEGSRTADARTDVYSLGCTLHKLLVGFPPPGRRGPAQVEGLHPLPRAVRPDIPPGVEAVLVRMLARRAQDRYASPGDVANVLRPFATGADLRAVLATARGESGAASAADETVGHDARTPPVGPARRSRWPRWRLGIAAGVVTVAVATSLALNRDPRPPADPPGHPPAPAAAPRVGEWHPLFVNPPTPVVWENPRQNHHFTLSDDRRRLRVESPTVGLIAFGRAERPAFRFQVELTQLPWSGGVGVFLGYRTIEWQGKPAERFQFLEVRQNKAGPSVGEFRLARGWAVVAAHPSRRAVAAKLDVANAPLGRFAGGRRYALAVDVAAGLLVVRWDGRLLPELSGPAVAAEFTEADAVGALGSYNYESTATFDDPQLMLLEGNL